jgi:HAD superfamily hydrolase (TIGR01509 family)
VIRGIIFDFDGLILETEGPVFQSWQELFQKFDCHLPFETWAQSIGRSDDPFNPWDLLEEQLGQPVDRENLAPKRRARELELIFGQPVSPGVEACIADAERMGLKLGIASSSTSDWVTGHLSRLGLRERFECIRGSDDVGTTKPNPDAYLAALRCLDLRAEEALSLEDSPHGITAAKRAGLLCIAVPNGLTRNLSLDHADLIVNSLAELSLEELLQAVET